MWCDKCVYVFTELILCVSLQKANTQGGEAKHWESSSSTRDKHDKKDQQSPDVKKETQEQKEKGEQEANNDELHKQQSIKNSDHSSDDEIVNAMNQQSLSHGYTKTQIHSQNQLTTVDLTTATSKPTEGQFYVVTSRRQQRKAKNAKSMNNYCSKKDLSPQITKDKRGRENGDTRCPHAHNPNRIRHLPPRFQQTTQGQLTKQRQQVRMHCCNHCKIISFSLLSWHTHNLIQLLLTPAERLPYKERNQHAPPPMEFLWVCMYVCMCMNMICTMWLDWLL